MVEQNIRYQNAIVVILFTKSNPVTDSKMTSISVSVNPEKK